MKSIKPLPTQSRLQELFDYSLITGQLYNKINRGRAKAGSIAGSDNGKGYKLVMIGGQNYVAHRIAWKLMTGLEPVKCIDHKDENPLNNAWHNLREATSSENVSYSSTNVGSTYKRGDKYQAKVSHDGKSIYLGTFDTEHMARLACLMMAQKLKPGFVPRHIG